MSKPRRNQKKIDNAEKRFREEAREICRQIQEDEARDNAERQARAREYLLPARRAVMDRTG